MDARTYYRLYGRKRCEEVAARAGSTWPTFRSYVYKKRRPKIAALATWIEASCGELTAEGLRPDLAGLIHAPAECATDSAAGPREPA